VLIFAGALPARTDFLNYAGMASRTSPPARINSNNFPATHVETDQSTEAIATEQKARNLAQAAGQRGTTDQSGEWLKPYQVNQQLQE
jgi:hypothetical protein